MHLVAMLSRRIARTNQTTMFNRKVWTPMVGMFGTVCPCLSLSGICGNIYMYTFFVRMGGWEWPQDKLRQSALKMIFRGGQCGHRDLHHILY